VTTEPEILEALGDRLAPDHTALLIVDMQRDFCDADGAAARAGRDVSTTREIVPAIGRLLHAARKTEVVVCHIGLWTLPDHASDSGPWLAQRRRSTYSSESVCVAGTQGADFIEELAPNVGELVVRKHRYSGFKGTDLDLLLRSRGVRSCVVTGVSTNVCVESTSRDAFELDYYVVVPRDSTASWSASLAEATFANLTHRFGEVPTGDEVAYCWVPEERDQ
jgi:nicotinamidase-related amidase